MKHISLFRNGALCFLAFLSSAVGFAAEPVTGSSRLTIWMDDSAQMSTVFINRRGNKIQGGAQFGGDIISLEKTATGWKGWAYGQNFDFSCEAGACENKTRGGSTLKWSDGQPGEFSLSGAMNFVPVRAEFSPEKILVQGDSSFELRRVSERAYNGRGVFSPPFGRLRTFTVRLEGDGDLTEIRDPALFSIFLITPFVRE